MLSEEQRIFLNEFVKGKWSITKKNNLVNVDGDIDFSHKDRHIILCNFNRIKGDFICSHNNLIWTNGAPKITEGDLDCSYNRLVKLPKNLWISYQTIPETQKQWLSFAWSALVLLMVVMSHGGR